MFHEKENYWILFIWELLFCGTLCLGPVITIILGGGRGGIGGGNKPNRGGGGGGDRGQQGGGGRFEHGQGGRGGFDRVLERLQTIHGPTTDLPNLDSTGTKFSGRSRLYITEESLKEMLAPFGEVGEIFYNRDKKFAFLRMATKYEAEKAKRELDGQVKNGQSIKVRFAPHQAAIKVQNLGPWVSNELLHRAFSIYGDIERALVYVDDRGRTKGEGIVEFVRKPSALEAVKRCTEGCYFLTASIRPVIAELDETTEDDDGLQEKTLIKRHQDYQFEREVGRVFFSAFIFFVLGGPNTNQILFTHNVLPRLSVVSCFVHLVVF